MSEKTIKVLIVEDNEAHAELVEVAFEDARHVFAVTIVSNLADARQRIATEIPDIVITDINLPDGKGSELVSAGGEEGLYPVIVMTSFGNEQLAVETMKLGVMDYIVKSSQTIASLPHIAERIYGEWQARCQKIAAEKEAARLAAAVSQAGESIMITDPAGIITYVNPFFEKMTGYRADEVIGRDTSFLRSGRQSQEFYDELWNTISSGKVWTGTFFNRKKDGTEFEEDAIITPVLDDGGAITSYVAVKRDVTGQRLLERQYIQSQKMAAIGQFAQKIVHDVTNALNVIYGNSHLARKLLKDNPDVLSYMDGINKATEKIAGMTSQLLAFANPTEPAMENISLNRIIKGMRELLTQTLPDSIDTVVQLDPDCGRLMLDPALIEQMIVHLALNAAEAMPEGGTLTVQTRSKPDEFTDGSYEMLEIRDTGCGIDEEQLRHIFEPFYSTKTGEKNAGLGLTTVFRIVEQHNGRITVDSTPGEGTTVRVFIPHAGNNE